MGDEFRDACDAAEAYFHSWASEKRTKATRSATELLWIRASTPNAEDEDFTMKASFVVLVVYERLAPRVLWGARTVFNGDSNFGLALPALPFRAMIETGPQRVPNNFVGVKLMLHDEIFHALARVCASVSTRLSIVPLESKIATGVPHLLASDVLGVGELFVPTHRPKKRRGGVDIMRLRGPSC